MKINPVKPDLEAVSLGESAQNSAFKKIARQPLFESSSNISPVKLNKRSEKCLEKDLNLSQLQLMLKDSSCQSVKRCNKENNPSKTNVKAKNSRKRKTERELKILRQELKRNIMWTRDSIKTMRAKYEDDFSMTEQQIYKWWWDQTRKRTKDTKEIETDSGRI